MTISAVRSTLAVSTTGAYPDREDVPDMGEKIQAVVGEPTP